ncbi:MAG: helix-turn-helix transcriptional regulator [Hungatella sp.]|nr:helix-turn-helix transcriptional regulator [Hungatella sp.]
MRQNVIGQYIRCRKEKGITQAELARRAGIPRTNVTRFESGTYNPSLEMLVRMAQALEMNLEIRLAKG